MQPAPGMNAAGRIVVVALVVVSAEPATGSAEDAVAAAPTAVSRETRAPRVPRVRRDARPAFEAESTELAWGGDVAAAIALGDRIALIGVGDGEGASVLHVDRATGKTLRQRPLGPDCGGVQVEGASYLVAVCGDDVVAIDPASLDERWRRPLGGRPRELTARGDLLVVSLDGTAPDPELGVGTGLVAFEATGRERWRAHVPTTRSIYLAEDANRIYAYEVDPTVWAFDRSTGARVWAAPMEQHITAVTPLGDGTIAVFRAGGVVRYDEAGREGAALVDHDVAGFAARGSWLYTIEPTAGEVDVGRVHGRDRATGRTWTYARPVSGPLTVGDGVIFACGPNGIVHAIDADTGAGRWWVDTGRECGVVETGAGVLAGGWRGAILVHDRPSRAPKVTIRGAFVDTVGGYELGGRGIWVGDQLVRTDRHGNFRATVRRGARISISLEDRGLPVDDVTLRRGDDTDVTLSTYYEDCH